MTEKLHFEVEVNVPPAVLWDAMLGEETYRDWTAEFAPGSRYEGSWEKGERIRFLDPAGNGLVAEVAESRPHEYVSLRHLGVVNEGIEDRTSDDVRAWVPAYENYTFTEAAGSTRVSIDVEVPVEWANQMREAWPRALARLKDMAEERSVGG